MTISKIQITSIFAILSFLSWACFLFTAVTNASVDAAIPIMIGLMLSGVLFLICVIVLTLSKPRNKYGALVITTICLAANLLYISRLELRCRKAKSEVLAEHLYQAINQFYRQNGSYPPRLEELVPDHIASVKSPLFKNSSFNYSVNNQAGDFELSYPIPLFLTCVREKSGWICSD